MGIFLYLMLPLNDGQDLDAMLRGVTWMLISAFLVLTGLLTLLVISLQRRPREPVVADPGNQDEHSPQP